jgi:hypothetical protein
MQPRTAPRADQLIQTAESGKQGDETTDGNRRHPAPPV